ncbi:MAG: recombinase family protein, partial [Lachnospiraceae bacterium]|nr:recombinase family protein [Lachnospiraceae bacterium]
MVQGRTRKAFYKGQPKHIVPEEEYIVVEGTHDPIISRDVFDRVQKMFEETRKEA